VKPFIYNALPMRVRFGPGARASVADEVRLLDCQRAVVISTAGRRAFAQEVSDLLGDLCVGVLDIAVMHTPVETTLAAVDRVQNLGADCTVAIGGGSAIGLAKALALRAGIPQIAIPTTYSGSEMTAIAGQTEAGRKSSVKDARVMPAAVIYDVELTHSLPVKTSATSGLNAMAHGVEALYARIPNPVTTRQALEGIEALARALPVIVSDPGAPAARGQALYGAFLCGMALSSVGMALHHKICHALGGAYDLPHAETHSVVLPHVTEFNAQGSDGVLAPVAAILETRSPGSGLFKLAKKIGAPASLKELGMPANGLDRVADMVMANPVWNPRSYGREDIVRLLGAAYRGEAPGE
jgi:maleylacetate reductase